MMLAADGEGKEIMTIEGLADPQTGELHPIQESFIKTGAIHFECRILLKTPMDPKCLDRECERLYPAKDYHTLYFGEILECYQTE